MASGWNLKANAQGWKIQTPLCPQTPMAVPARAALGQPGLIRYKSPRLLLRGFSSPSPPRAVFDKEDEQ